MITEAHPTASPARREIGDLAQVASARPIRFDEGPESGVRAIDVRVAGGIDAMVLVDRGMDLGPAWCMGQPLGWVSTTGSVHPAHAQTHTWLESFHGGLLTTCGLRNVGPDNEHDGERHGLHGRVSSLQGRGVATRTFVDGGRIIVEVTGEVRETSVFGPDVVLRRTLRFHVGRMRIDISDVITNRAYRPEPLFILYHVNLGWPVVSESSEFLAPARATIPRDAIAAAAVADHHRFTPPDDDAGPQVFEHRFSDLGTDDIEVAVVNRAHQPTSGIGVAVRFNRSQLPRLWHWRNLAPGAYLTGLEPANCGVAGRDAELAGDDPPDILPPGEERRFDLSILAATGADLETWLAPPGDRNPPDHAGRSGR